MENCPKGLKLAFLGISGRKEIHPCVLQDIGPLGPLPKKENNAGYTATPDMGGQGRCWRSQDHLGSEVNKNHEIV